MAGAQKIQVRLSDREVLPARVVGTDQATDIALIKIAPKETLTVASLGDSERLRVGEWVVAVGNPFGLGGTVTAGIVSARNRAIGGAYDDYIQTDASINKGNSGGPLFNMAGEVIGVNTAILSPTGGSVGIGFATPSNTVQPVIDQLQQFGETRRGWLGVRIQNVDDQTAESLDLGKPRGALGVTAGEVDHAGLRAAERERAARVAHEGHAAAADGERRHDGAAVVDRVDAAVGEDQVGRRLLRRERGGGEECGDGGGTREAEHHSASVWGALLRSRTMARAAVLMATSPTSVPSGNSRASETPR